MHTVYVVMVKTESTESNESILLDYGLWKVTGESEDSALRLAHEKIRKLNAWRSYSFTIYTDPPALPDNHNDMPF